MYAYSMRAQLEPKGKRHEYWILGPEYSDAEKEFRVLYNDITKLGLPMDRPGTYYDAAGGNMHLSLFGGRFLVAGKSAKYPDQLVGEGLHGVIMAEAAKMKATIWPKYVRPMLADYAREPIPSWSLFNSTPEGKNWFYELWRRGQNPDPDDASWWSIRMPSWSNNFLFPGGREDPEIKEMERDMSAEKFKQEIGADFTEFVGRVFKNFEEETCVGDYPFNPRWPVFIAEDAGFTNPSVALFIQVDVFDNVWICGEYYRRHRTPSEFADDILEDPKLRAMAEHASLLYPDPADPGTAATLEKKWNVRAMGGTGGEIQTRLELIRRWLRPQPLELPDDHPDKTSKLKVDRSCHNTIREMLDYRYPENRNELGSNPTENPMKKDDHIPEALGRFFVGHFGVSHVDEARARVSKASVRRGR